MIHLLTAFTFKKKKTEAAILDSDIILHWTVYISKRQTWKYYKKKVIESILIYISRKLYDDNLRQSKYSSVTYMSTVNGKQF